VLAFDPTRRIVPTTITKIVATITACSAISGTIIVEQQTVKKSGHLGSLLAKVFGTSNVSQKGDAFNFKGLTNRSARSGRERVRW